MPKGVVVTDTRRKLNVDGPPDEVVARQAPHLELAAEAATRETDRPSWEHRVDWLRENLDTVLDYMIVLEDDPATKVGSIWKPQQSQSPATSGNVIVAGPDVKLWKEGDKVIFPVFSGTVLPLGGWRVRMMKETEAMVKVKTGRCVLDGTVV